jgi:hypothetical protein
MKQGQHILLGVAGSAVLIVGLLGWIIGSNASEVSDSIRLFGLNIVIPTTPVSLSLYGILFSILVLSTVFGLVVIASQRETMPK